MSRLSAVVPLSEVMLFPRPVVFGEVLFDVFPDGRRVLGGAPFNVAWHLQGFGLEPHLVSRVGRDAEGAEVVRTMRSWGMSVRGIQRDDRHPTGRVEVTIQDGEPSFEIGAEQAYDFIQPEADDLESRTGGASLLYHGSLGIRSETSWRTLEGLNWPPVVVCDLNLRKPWWTRSRVEWCLGRATWVKVNAHELEVLAGQTAAADRECLAAAKQLARQFEIPNLIVTRGERGALGLVEGATIWEDAVRLRRLADTVGAGDGFSSVMILGILKGWDGSLILRRAARFAAEICGQRGATSLDRSLYASLDSGLS